MKKSVIGVVGCGAISDIYMKNLTQTFGNTLVKAVCDLDSEKTERTASKLCYLQYRDEQRYLSIL